MTASRSRAFRQSRTDRPRHATIPAFGEKARSSQLCWGPPVALSSRSARIDLRPGSRRQSHTWIDRLPAFGHPLTMQAESVRPPRHRMKSSAPAPRAIRKAEHQTPRRRIRSRRRATRGGRHRAPPRPECDGRPTGAADDGRPAAAARERPGRPRLPGQHRDRCGQSSSCPMTSPAAHPQRTNHRTANRPASCLTSRVYGFIINLCTMPSVRGRIHP